MDVDGLYVVPGGQGDWQNAPKDNIVFVNLLRGCGGGTRVVIDTW